MKEQKALGEALLFKHFQEKYKLDNFIILLHALRRSLLSRVDLCEFKTSKTSKV